MTPLPHSTGTCVHCGEVTIRDSVQIGNNNYFWYDACQSKNCPWSAARKHWELENERFPVRRNEIEEDPAEDGLDMLRMQEDRQERDFARSLQD